MSNKGLIINFSGDANIAHERHQRDVCYIEQIRDYPLLNLTNLLPEISTWNNQSCNVELNSVLAPDDTLTAHRLTATSSAWNGLGVNGLALPTLNKRYLLSVWAKSVNTNRQSGLYLREFNSSPWNAFEHAGLLSGQWREYRISIEAYSSNDLIYFCFVPHWSATPIAGTEIHIWNPRLVEIQNSILPMQCDIVQIGGSVQSAHVVGKVDNVAGAVTYAVQNSYDYILYGYANMWNYRMEWGVAYQNEVQAICAHDSNLKIELVYPPYLIGAITCGGGVTNNVRSYGNGLEFFDATYNDRTDQSGTIASIMAKLERIKRELNCGHWEARYRSRMTASGSGEWNKFDGYGRINTDDAIAFSGTIPEYFEPPITTTSVVVERIEESNLISWTLIPNVSSYKIYRTDSYINEPTLIATTESDSYTDNNINMATCYLYQIGYTVGAQEVRTDLVGIGLSRVMVLDTFFPANIIGQSYGCRKAFVMGYNTIGATFNEVVSIQYVRERNNKVVLTPYFRFTQWFPIYGSWNWFNLTDAYFKDSQLMFFPSKYFVDELTGRIYDSLQTQQEKGYLEQFYPAHVITGLGDNNNISNYDIEFFDIDPLAENNYMYSMSYIAGKLFKIKDALNCSWWEARYRARMTASGGGEWDSLNGYGKINTNDAIAFVGDIPDDPYKILESPVLSYEKIVDDVKLTWTDVEAVEYKLYKRNNSNEAWVLINTTTNLEYLDEDYDSKADNYYRVDALGYNVASSNVVCVYGEIPDTPTGLQIGRVYDNAYLTWDAMQYADEYRIYRSERYDLDTELIGVSNTPQWRDVDSKSDKTYIYQVSAYRRVNDYESAKSGIVYARGKSAIGAMSSVFDILG